VVSSIGDIPETETPLEEALVFAACSPLRAPNEAAEVAYTEIIRKAKKDGDTLGGILTLVAKGLPIGLGSYVTPERRLDARIGAAMFATNAIKGVEFAEAFKNTTLPGSELHDPILRNESGHITRPTNRCGGLEAGITNGMPIVVRVAMKPIPTTLKPQQSIDFATGESAATTYERSDTCPVPRACVVLESALLLTLADALIEKIGGDSIEEMKPRFDALPTADDISLSPESKIFWPK
ncbi:MAG: chorismate synthase, partial [bacterium]|nr:chorismate synthase [bacterium]